MTQNLRLGATPGALTTAKSFTLTNSDSDVSSNYTVSTSSIANSGTDNWGSSNTDSVYQTNHVYLTGDETYGNYYNWYTATAGTGKRSSLTSGDATASIRPSSGTSGTSWKLPPNTGNGSYTNLFQTKLGWVSSTTGTDTSHFGDSGIITQLPYSFALSGSYFSGVSAQGNASYLWSRTAKSSTNAHNFGFGNNGYFGLQQEGSKYSGFSVRCVLVAS